MPAGTSHTLPSTSYNVTNTGLDRITSGLYAWYWLIGNDGRNTIAAPGTRSAGLFILSSDFQTALANIDVNAAGTVQGVAFDPSDSTIWFVDTEADTIRRCDQAGALLQSISLPYTPNGLAYIAQTDELVVSELGTFNRHVYAAVDGTFVRSFDGVGSTYHDMLHWNAHLGLMFETSGGNGVQGAISYYPLDVTSSAQRTTAHSHKLDLQETPLLAIEGLYIDVDAGRIFVNDDSYTHAVGSATSAVIEIDATDKLSLPLDATRLRITMSGDFGPHLGNTDLIVGSMGQVLQAEEQSWGLYRLSGGGFRFFSGLNADGNSFYINWPSVTTPVADLEMVIDLTADTYALTLNGVLQTPASYGSATTMQTWAHSFRMDDVALGGSVWLSNGQTARQIGQMTVESLRIDTGDQS